MVATPVHLVQPGETRGHDVVGTVTDRLVGLMVPRTAVVDPPAGEVVISATEVGGAEGSDNGQIVGGVVNSP